MSTWRSVRVPVPALAAGLFLIVLSAAPSLANEVIVLRSGNAAIGSPDPMITMLAGPGGGPLSANPFTPADFDAACGGPNAYVVQPISAWLQELPCDPEARWIGFDANATPASAIYCYSFEVETCCIERASLSFCWATDDVLGDLPGGGPNPDGVYLNGVPVNPSIFGGNYAGQTEAAADVTDLLQCGTNRLEIYNLDLGFVVSGVIFSATIDITECVTPTRETSWGAVKSLYD